MEKFLNSRNTDNGTIFKQVGFLRVVWAVIVVFCLVMVFFSEGDDTGWNVIPVHVAPVLVILNIWGLLFDLLMTWLFMMQKSGQERQRYRHVLLWDGLLLVALFAFWGPFFASLLTGS
jgi:protein-S-isoprenylcysteine O-methyltransferase Ste14